MGRLGRFLRQEIPDLKALLRGIVIAQRSNIQEGVQLERHR
jgi:hypothetical protein